MIDADDDMTAGVVELMNNFPGTSVDLYSFVKVLAFVSSDPITFTAENDGASNTKLRFTLTFTDSMGNRHAVTSKYYHRLMYQAAVLENQAMEAKSKAYSRRKKSKPASFKELPLFAPTETRP